MNPHTVLHRGCPLTWFERGTGAPVLLVQGVGVHGCGWRPQVDDLSRDHRCLWFDNRGIGGSTPRGTTITVPQMAEDALQILDAAGVQRAHVVGHSLGGVVAQELALAAPERVRSLSLLCTMARGSDAGRTPGMAWLGVQSRIGTRRARRRAFLRIVLPDRVLETADPDQLAAEYAELFGHDLAAHPLVEYLQLAALQRADTSSRLHGIRVPTLVVAARHDRIAPPRLGRALCDAIPGARFIEVPDAGHGAPIQVAVELNARLREHFAGAAEP
jgi:pimeloyl-ACP methyl ester carboxylesterase